MRDEPFHSKFSKTGPQCPADDISSRNRTSSKTGILNCSNRLPEIFMPSPPMMSVWTEIFCIENRTQRCFFPFKIYFCYAEIYELSTPYFWVPYIEPMILTLGILQMLDYNQSINFWKNTHPSDNFCISFSLSLPFVNFLTNKLLSRLHAIVAVRAKCVHFSISKILSIYAVFSN